MVRLGFVLLAAPALAARVQEHGTAFAHLSSEDSVAAVDALQTLEQLKVDSSNVELQEKYREAIGEIEWEEARAFLLSGMSATQEPVMLGQPSQPGTTMNMMEMLTGRLGSMRWFSTRLGRLFTSRRDFALEEEGGETKYMIDGFVRSLHSRMQISFPNDADPKFVVRRAFNYLNPVAVSVGQYVYRVVRCLPNSQGGWAGGCDEGDMLYTITKDRLGRGALWGQDEYRVYTGTGGCSRWGSGVISCNSEHQIMYSLSAGLSDMSHATRVYAGQINALDSGFDTGRLHSGEELDAAAIEAMKVAVVDKFEGSPRALNWPIWLTSWGQGQVVADASGQVGDFVATLTESQIMIIVAENGGDAMQRWDALQAAMSPAQEAAISALGVTGQLFLQVNSALYYMAWAYHLAKSLVWADSYHINFDGQSTDELLVSIVAAVQDLTREQIAVRPATGLFGGSMLPGTVR